MAFIYLPEHTEEWHAHRLKYIGGSECASLFGEEDKSEDDGEEIKAGFSDSIFSLHYIKSGSVKPRNIESERVDAGIYMEPAIASFVADRRGWKIAKGRYAIDDTTQGMGASLDYEVFDAGPDAGGAGIGGSVLKGSNGPLVGPGLMQIKNVDSRQFARKWKDEEPPLYIIVQVQHELACSGYQWAVLAAWVGGNSLKLYFYHPHEEIISHIRQRVTEFWDRVAKGIPPAADGSDATNYVLRQLYPVMKNNDAQPLDLSGDNEVPGLCAELIEASRERLRLTKEEKRLKARLSQIMGNATYAVCGQWVIKCSVEAEKAGRPPRPGELIGAKSEVRKYTVKEIA